MESRCPCTRDGGEEDGPEDGPEDDHKNGVWKLMDGFLLHNKMFCSYFILFCFHLDI